MKKIYKRSRFVGIYETVETPILNKNNRIMKRKRKKKETTHNMTPTSITHKINEKKQQIFM